MARRKVTRGAPPQLARSNRDRTGSRSAAANGRSTSRSSSSDDDGPNFLSLYFREMSELGVMDPAAELAAASNIAQLRTEYWKALLAFPVLTDAIAALLESKIDAEEVPAAELLELRKCSKDLLEKTTKKKQKSFDEAVVALSEFVSYKDLDGIISDLVAADLTLIESGASEGVNIAITAADAEDRLAFAAYVKRAKLAGHALRLAKNMFVKSNLRLVVSIARRFNHGRMPLQDLIQEGNIGLMKAVDRFDHRKGFRFSTYGSWWIRHAISRAVADKGRQVRLPVHMIDAYHKVNRARRELEMKHGQEPTSAQIAAHTGIAESKIERMGSLLLENPVSLDKPVSGEDGRRMVEFVEDPNADAPVELLEANALNDEVRHLMSMLRPIEADILRKRFGLTDENELTLKEIGGQYSLSRERIRQLQEQALGKIRRELKRRELM